MRENIQENYLAWKKDKNKRKEEKEKLKNNKNGDGEIKERSK